MVLQNLIHQFLIAPVSHPVQSCILVLRAASFASLVDFKGATGIKVVHKSRVGRAKGRGGGIAIAFDSSTCNFKQRQLKHIKKDHEVVCAVGTIGKIPRRIAAFTVYVPPCIREAQLESLKEAVATEVAAVKATYKPLLVVAGDFNRRDFGPALSEVDDLNS